MRRLSDLSAWAKRDVPALAPEPAWGLDELRGRLCEIVGAGVTPAFRLVLDAQAAREPVAWIAPRATCFYPPDAAESGVDLDALAVVRLPAAADVPRAADMLLRSGAFGLLVLDTGSVDVPMAAQARLLGLAQKHSAAVVFLTKGVALGSLISLRVDARRKRRAPGSFACEISVIKDKRRAPGWTFAEVC